MDKVILILGLRIRVMGILVSSFWGEIVRSLRLKVSSPGNTHAHVQYHFLWCMADQSGLTHLNLISFAHNTVTVSFFLRMVSLSAAQPNKAET